uniref:Uncharacterized protein n=1 Tax=Romanomermis culicivorax TaxID=13658 RepID=A0A915HZK5_ROMCU
MIDRNVFTIWLAKAFKRFQSNISRARPENDEHNISLLIFNPNASEFSSNIIYILWLMHRCTLADTSPSADGQKVPISLPPATQSTKRHVSVPLFRRLCFGDSQFGTWSFRKWPLPATL